MAELPVEMPNLLNFPMEKLCYDLVLEVIDELEPKDVPELMKADRRFRGILLQKPARILGKQIHLISVEMDDRESLDDGRKRYHGLVFIMKFAESRPLPFYFLSHKVLLLSQVERCSALNIIGAGWGSINTKKLSALKKAFANLKQVDELGVILEGDNFNDFLLNLKAGVTDRASLNCNYLNLQLISSLINGSLQNCKMIQVDLYHVSGFHPTVYEALSKTQLELFMTDVYSSDVKSTIEWILNSGIPSENKEAACFLQGEMGVEINNLIKDFPEIRQVNEPNIRTFIRDTMMETLRKHRVMDDSDRSRSPPPPPAPPRSRSVSVSAESLHSMDGNPMQRGVEHYESLSISAESLSDPDDSLHSMDRSPIKGRVGHYVSLGGPIDCYLKRIDEKRDCIYVVNDDFFFTKYVSSIQF